MVHRLLVICVVALATACVSPVGPREPVEFQSATRPAGSSSFPNWDEPPDVAMKQMATAHPVFDSAAPTATGTSGAEKIDTLWGESHRKFKEKVVPKELDGINNAPRKELAAYAIQRLFLDPVDYVVPATSLRCVPLDTWEAHHGSARAETIDGTRCVLVALAVWLKDVTVPEVLFDRERFLTEPNYAYYMSNMNVLTYLISHQDGREGNFLVSKDDRRQVFAIDNGVSFGQPWPYYNWFVPNWNVLRVPAVRKDSIERLRGLERKDLDFLLVVAQLEPDANGILQLVEPGPPHDEQTGATLRGTTVQFGLTDDEIDDVWDRIEDLIEEVDEGDLPVF